MGNNNKRILVTGAGGYIGRHLISSLLDMNYNVTAISSTIKDIDKRAEIIQENIFNLDSDSDFSNLAKNDICIHLAWRDGFLHNSENHILELSKHYVFLKRLIKKGLKQLAVVGTMHEIGYWEGEINESTPTNPRSLYGIAKNSLRQALMAESSNTELLFQWLRVFYIIGDDLNNNSIFTKILQWDSEGKKTFPFTSGENKYDFIDIKTLVQYIAAVIGQTKFDGIINCCSGIPVSLRDKVESFIAEHKLEIRPEYNAFPDRPYDSPAVWGCNKKILKIIADSKEVK